MGETPGNKAWYETLIDGIAIRMDHAVMRKAEGSRRARRGYHFLVGISQYFVGRTTRTAGPHRGASHVRGGGTRNRIDRRSRLISPPLPLFQAQVPVGWGRLVHDGQETRHVLLRRPHHYLLLRVHGLPRLRRPVQHRVRAPSRSVSPQWWLTREISCAPHPHVRCTPMWGLGTCGA